MLRCLQRDAAKVNISQSRVFAWSLGDQHVKVHLGVRRAGKKKSEEMFILTNPFESNSRHNIL